MIRPGGPANKIGNRYETSWTIAELVRMLHGGTQAVHLEPFDANKVEFIVMKTDSCRELHQVKRGKWSFADLRRDGLIRAIGDQLKDSDDRFVFASGSEARELAELCEAARVAKSTGRLEDVFLTSADRCRRFRQLRCDWRCESRTVVDILGRIEVRTIGERDLELQIRYGVQALFLATPDDVIDAIRGIVEGSVYRIITRDALIEKLSRRGYRLRRLSSVEHASSALRRTTYHYLDGTRRKLIQNTLVSTTAATELLSRLNGTATETVLTGGAGYGKTACVFGVVEELRKRGMPVLAFRLDRLPPSVSNSKALGDYLDMEDSPSLVLATAVESVGRPGVLVIDQLDAVSAMSGRNADALAVVEQLLHEVRGRTRTPIHTVVVCRAFDWKHDSSLRQLFPDDDHSQVDVAEFTNVDVEEILRKADFDPSLFEPRQLKLLHLPQNLSIFLEADVDASRPPTFDTRTKLFDAYWDAKRRSTATDDAGDHWMAVVTTLCDAMADTQQLSVPRETLDGVSPVYLSRLGSEGVITFDGRRYGFGHESFFDYCFARLSMNQRQPLASLLKMSEQHLFRRSQVRQMLAYLRDTRFNQYIQELRDLFADQEIRAHIKDLAFNLLAEIRNPTDEEWMIWMTSIEPTLKAVEQGNPNRDKLSALAWRRFFGSMSWFSSAYQRDLIQRWLSSGNDGLADMAVSYLRVHHRRDPDRVAELLSPYVGAGGTWKNRLRSFMETTEHHTSRAHFDLLLRLVDNETLDDISRPFWQILYRLDEKRPEWIPEIVAHRLRRRVATIRSSGYDLRDRELIGYDDIAVTMIRNSAKRAPAEFVEHVLPVILDISDSTLIDDNLPKRDGVWGIHSSKDLTGEDACLSGSAAALEALARDATSNIGNLIDELERRETYVANHLLLALYRGGAARYADDAASLVCNQPWRLKCGYADSPNWCSMELIRAVIKYCNTESRRTLEAMLLNYLSPFERSRDGQKYKMHGQTRFDLLSAIPKDLRSDQANRHFSELKRKFGHPAAEPRGVVAGLVTSPIDKTAIPLMTDDQWLRAIQKYHTEHPRHTQGLLRGGAWELAGELNERAKVEPERFARLSRKLPSDANPAYMDRILAAIQDATLPTKLKLEVCRKAFEESCDHCSKSITDVLGRIEDPLPDDAVGMLDWLATEHDEPSKEGWRKSADNDTVYYNGDILTNGIHSTRGRAAQAIHNLIVNDSAYVERFRPTIDRMIVDPSAAVISCVAGTVAAVAYWDPALGMTLFKSMNLSEDRLLATHYVCRFIGNNLSTYFAELRPIIERMLRSAESEVCEAGARLASLAALHHHHAADIVDEALRGGPQHRRGVAKIAANNVVHSECRDWCEAKLVKLFDDEDADVRRNAALCFSHVPDDVLHSYKDLISSFCSSKAFNGCSFWLVRALEKSRGRLPGITCMVCERYLENPSRESMEVTNLVFRTYQQHQSDEWTSPSLDLIDRLCLEGIIGTEDELDQYDR